MDFIENYSEFYEIAAPVIKSSGFELVDFSSAKLTDGFHIHIVLYSNDGISINDCGKVHRLLQKRLEVHTGERNVFLEVSSPGINRNFKSANEFLVFKGRKVKILTDESNEWIVYRIKDADSKNVTLEPLEETVYNSNSALAKHSADKNFAETDKTESINELKLQYSKIRKAKLD